MTSNDQLIESLDLPGPLKHRVLCRVPSSAESTTTIAATPSSSKKKTFVLYLPTVVLRKRHNPGFSLACRLANHYDVPVIVLCTVLDDHHLSTKPVSPVVMTARRLAFTIEALQSCCKQWEDHGAGVAVRVHSPNTRTPHHLTLSHQAMAVVSDEPFVDPYRNYLQRIVKTCQSAKVPCYTVDGSTTVPPKSVLRINQTMDGDISFTGAPNKAWKWEQQTNSARKSQVYGVVKDHALDAPDLMHKLLPNFFLPKAQHDIDQIQQEQQPNNNKDTETTETIINLLPMKWIDTNAASPGQRPWTVTELLSIQDCKDWAMKWDSADTSVPPCQQTHGSEKCAKQRWQSFVQSGLKEYAKRRNQIVHPHGVSRISCYLNLGILSIFDVINDVWQAKASKTGYSNGCTKFLDEVVKWREGSYVHAFAYPKYHSVDVLPPWSVRYMNDQHTTTSSSTKGFTYEQLESGSSGDEVWDAMQKYLVETGELHNNARMTWGKTVVHWQVNRFSPSDVLWQLICLNDRFALDGVSPPSYGGVLWCFGWQDKPSSGNKISEKPAHRYRTGPQGFEQAKEALYSHKQTTMATINTLDAFLVTKRSRSEDDTVEGARKKSPSKPSPQSKTSLSYFSPVNGDNEGSGAKLTIG